MKIPIKKHTPVRMPQSIHTITPSGYYGYSRHLSIAKYGLVTDITRVWKPHDTWTISSEYKYTSSQPKETLWQKIKRYYKEGLTE